MRLRLALLLMVLISALLTLLAIPLSSNIAHRDEQRVFADRLRDAVRLAGVAQQAETPVDDRELDEQLERYSTLYGVATAVLDANGGVRARYGKQFSLDAPAISQPMSVALSGHPSSDDRAMWPWETRDIVVAVPVLRGDDVVQIVVTVSPTAALRGQVRTSLLGLAAAGQCMLLASVLLVSRLSRWVLRPVDQLDRATGEIARGRLKARVGAVTGPPELRRLAGSFNRMANRVEQMMEHQIAFVADASHQLRTPLAGLTLRIENLQAQVEPDRLDEVGALADEVQRLNAILDSLLRLAAVDQIEPDLQDVDVRSLVGCRVLSWTPQAQARAVTLLPPTGAASLVLTAHADPTLFGSALDAILDNAIKFSPPNGTVTVRLSAEAATVHCVVADNGAGLLDTEYARIGNRFWRSLRHQNVDGTGLGLAIVRTLQAAVGGDVAFAPNTPSGLMVTLSLPRRPDKGS
ncbi:MAG: HAMP domain-containing histidine kinase [Catenulispora sp.]|nr:HAMP domain-containing histidine kinase [Catenulispora sp.]